MKILYYDCFCGISGDMNLAALLDLGVPEEYLRQELSKLKIDAEYELQITRSVKMGISGTRVDVHLTTPPQYAEVSLLEQNHHHHHHGNDNKHHKREEKEHLHHASRNLQDIEELIQASELKEKVKAKSCAMFKKLAEAEGRVHGKTLYEVHFHEVGATDSIVDIVGAAICLDYLKVDKIWASEVQVGGGFVKCAHGTMPVPAPATVEILRGIPIKAGLVAYETTTPTGAVILASNVHGFGVLNDFSIKKVAYGIGHRDLAVPNVLRVYLGTLESDATSEKRIMLETNIDDMNMELYSHIEEKLFAKGAIDVFKTVVAMKKGRTGIQLSVLVDAECEAAVLGVIFRETTSIGIRKYVVERNVLRRDFTQAETEFGVIRVKNSYYQGERVNAKPEYEDCKRLADEHDVPIKTVYSAAYKAIEDIKNESEKI
ncbi:nickel pincer cofactor biosynthesis protein LarC [Azotosporobacter soli]|uniref:nickel pincer cofactor biosynthesis protein LarC n=1 Tax=Azotosporobacter soli TaxID=3055040 RepID=UPI0031FEF3F3